MSTTQNRNRSGRFPKGVSGNPAGRPKGLAKATRVLVGDEGMKLAAFWLSIMEDPMRRDSDRLEASRLLADRGWGQGSDVPAAKGDPFDREEVEAAPEEFRKAILRLAPQADSRPD